MQPQKESHYINSLETINSQNPSEKLMGVSIAWAYYDDPKRLAFTFSRYKFAAKMLDGKKSILEIGCGDGFATRMLRQVSGNVTGIDVDNDFIEDAKKRISSKWNITFKVHDLVHQGAVEGEFEGVVCLDVLEHITFANHDLFLTNLVASMSSNGELIIGCPSLESQAWASPQSKLGHVACMSQNDLKAKLLRYFRHVFMFSMNDEVVHTGFSKMSHYNLAICTL